MSLWCKTRRVAAAVALAAGLAAGGAWTGAQAAQVLNVGNGSEPDTLDPQRSSDTQTAQILYSLLEGLVTLGPAGQIVPGVAESWDIAEDGLTYTFHLRANAKWSNGDPVTADDFVYSLRRGVDPKTGSIYQFILYPIVNAKEITDGTEKDVTKMGVAATDPRTLMIKLKEVTPFFLGLLTHHMGMPVNRKAIEANGNDWTKPGKFVGNGAFKLSEWVPQSKLTVVKNEAYWDAANVKLDQVTYKPIESEAAEFNAYRAGELDVTNLVPAEQLANIRQTMASEFRLSPRLGTYYYSLNMTREPFKSNPNLRRALSLAIDRDFLVEKITAAGELPATSFTPPSVANYKPPQAYWASMSKADRLAEAKKAFAAAGYGPSKPLKLEILYNTADVHKRIAVAVAGMWKQALGVETELRNVEFKVKLAEVRARNYTVSRDGWIADYDDVNTFLSLNKSDALDQNTSGYSNPAYDKLVDQASATQDLKKRADIYAQAEAILLNDDPVVPLYFYVNKTLVKPYVKGYENAAQGFHLAKYMSVEPH